MNLQHQRIQALCEELKLPAVRTEWPTLAQHAADTQASFADFLTSLLHSEGGTHGARAPGLAEDRDTAGGEDPREL